MAKVGFGIAWRDLVHATSIPPVWLTPMTGVIERDAPPSVLAVVTSIIVLSLLVTATVWAWLRRHRVQMVLCTTAVVACTGAFLTAASAPVDYRPTEFLYPRRFWWAIGAFVWIALAYSAVQLVARGRRSEAGERNGSRSVSELPRWCLPSRLRRRASDPPTTTDRPDSAPSALSPVRSRTHSTDAVRGSCEPKAALRERRRRRRNRE